MFFANKNVFITGASRGIGLAIARTFAKEGATVLMTARSGDKLRDEANVINQAGERAWYHPMDVTDDASVYCATQAALKEFGQIHLLINNAAVAYQGYFLQQPQEIARQEMEANYFGLLRVVRALLPSMIEKQEGTLVTVASVTGRIPYPTQATYSASKAAIIAFSQALRGEVEPHGIRVVIVLPGLTDTDMAKALRTEGPPPQSPEAVAQVVFRAASTGKREVISGFPNRMFVGMSKLMPGLIERVMADSAKKAMEKK